LRQRWKEFNIGDRHNCPTARGTIALGVPNPKCHDVTGSFADDAGKVTSPPFSSGTARKM